MRDTKPADHIAQLRRDGYIDAADCMQRLYDAALNTAVDNLHLRGQARLALDLLATESAQVDALLDDVPMFLRVFWRGCKSLGRLLTRS